MYVFEIPANHLVYDKLYCRGDKDVYRLLFDIDDNSFREKLKFESFQKFLIGECKYDGEKF